MFLLAEAIEGITLSIPQLLTVCGIIIGEAITLFGFMMKIMDRFSELKERVSITEEKFKSIQEDQTEIKIKLGEILETLNVLNASVATLSERTRRA